MVLGAESQPRVFLLRGNKRGEERDEFYSVFNEETAHVLHMPLCIIQ